MLELADQHAKKLFYQYVLKYAYIWYSNIILNNKNLKLHVQQEENV